MSGQVLTRKDVVGALTTLYTHPDAVAKKEANAWLVDFQLKHPSAWEVAYQLLDSQLPEEVQFFGVHTLHTKIQREWETLSVETRSAISNDLMVRLQALCADPKSQQQRALSTVSSRMCSCVAAAGVRMAPIPWNTLVQDIIALTKLPHPPTTYHVVLAVLSVLPEELEAGRITQKKKMEAKKVLQEAIPSVLELSRQVLCPSAPAFTSSTPSLPTSPPSSPLSSPMLSPSAPSYRAQVDAASVPLHAAALRCVRAWVEWGVPVTDLLTDGGTLLGATFDALATPELLSFAADVLVELFTPPRQLTSGLVVSSSRLCFDQALFQEIVRASIARVLSCVPLYQQAVTEKRTEVCIALSRVASAIGCGNPSTVLSTEEGLELLKFILTCSSHTEKKVVMPTLEFWETTASLASSNPVTQLNLNQHNTVATITSSLSALLPTLIAHCRFARDVSPDASSSESSRRYTESAENRSQEHDVLDFRLAAIDPLLAVFRALSAPRYLQLLAETLQPQPQQQLSWQTLEAVVYAMKVVTEENSTEFAHGNALQLAARLVEGVAEIMAPGVTQHAIPALLASSFAGLVKTLPLEVWQHGPLTSKCVAVLIALLSFPPRTSVLFLENVAYALVELTTQSLLTITAPIFAPHLPTIANACVSSFLSPGVRDLLATTFLSIARISLPADQAGQILSDMVSSLASRIVQHTNTTHAVSLEATLEVVADVQIIDSLVGSKIPINEQLITNLTQLLETVAQRVYAKEGASVIDAVCRVCTTLLSLPNYTASHTQAVNILVATYVKTGQASPLKALAYAINPNKGKSASGPNVSVAGGALEQVLAQVASFSVSHIASLSIDTLGSFFWTMTCAAQVSPPLASVAPALLPVANAAIQSLSRMLEDPLAATYAIAYLALVPTTPLLAEHLPALRDSLVELVFHVLPHVQERSLIRPLADMLHSLITHPQHGAAARNAAQGAVMRCSGFVRFTDEERARIVRVLLAIPAKPRFRAMFTDLFGIAAGESDLDALLAYEM